MTDPNIVARLRLYANASIDGGWASVFRADLNIAADEIERLHRDYSCICGEMRRMMDERDEARWRLCKVVGDNRGVWGCEIAKENGWDYLATEAKP